MASNIETSFQAAKDSGKINGAVICATNSNGDFVYNKAIGERTLLSGEKRPQRLDDVLFLASATKLVTSIAALQCVEDGLLTLDGDLSSIAPELSIKEVIKGFAEDDKTPILEPAKRPITLKMLLTHSAGTAYDFLAPLVGKWRQQFSPRTIDQRKSVEELLIYPLSHQPGAGWTYGHGPDWAGRIVERVTGYTLGDYVLRRILAPLGSKDAQFYPVTREDLRVRLVDLNPDDPNGQGRAVLGEQGDLNLYGKGDFGGHGLFMPGSDYVKILHSLLANDGKLLKTDTVEDMFKDHLTPESTEGHQAVLAGPWGALFRMGVNPDAKISYGLGGLLTLEDIDGFYGSNTLSWGGGATLIWFIDRKNDLCGIAAIQARLPLDIPAITELKQVFQKDIYRKYSAWKEQSKE
ncbi:hypothetical protein TrVFT333_006465 [Trichoderma virens FT-333]|nr:hypothetical protein TrVFT333_006465 [Trichoderma virens FT-333]